MVVAGLGMGLLQPVYTLAVQNVAPRERMGAATSSTIFFRSIGSTVGVAAFGTIMLTRYHNEFAQGIPRGAGKRAAVFRESAAAGAGAAAARSRVRPRPGGLELLQTLFAGVKAALLHGLQQIFFWSAAIMSVSIVLHLVLKREPLRVRAPVDAPEGAACARTLSTGF